MRCWYVSIGHLHCHRKYCLHSLRCYFHLQYNRQRGCLHSLYYLQCGAVLYDAVHSDCEPRLRCLYCWQHLHNDNKLRCLHCLHQLRRWYSSIYTVQCHSHYRVHSLRRWLYLQYYNQCSYLHHLHSMRRWQYLCVTPLYCDSERSVRCL